MPVPSRLRFLPLAIFAAMILIVAWGLHHARRAPAATDWVGRPAPVTWLPLIRDSVTASDGHFKSSAWRGRPYLLHFFASWCPDCRAEQEELLTLQAAHIPIIGIAFQDRATAVTAYLDEAGNPFLAVARDPDGQAARDWGVTAIPASFLIDADGIVRWQSDGAISADMAENTVMPLYLSLSGPTRH